MSASTLEIQLLGKAYKVACSDQERTSLQAAAALLNARLLEAAGRGKASHERVAMMVALNLAHDLLSRHADSEHASTDNDSALDSDVLLRKIQSIETRIDEVLQQA